MASVSSGSSLYSCVLILCASTLARSETEVRREASLLTVICLSHAEDVANRATRRVPHDDHSTLKQAETDHPGFTVVLPSVFDLDGDALEDQRSVLKIKASLKKSLLSLGEVEGQSHADIVNTKTSRCKGRHRSAACAGCQDIAQRHPSTCAELACVGEALRLTPVLGKRQPDAGAVARDAWLQPALEPASANWRRLRRAAPINPPQARPAPAGAWRSLSRSTA
jgi:hypothetical protein